MVQLDSERWVWLTGDGGLLCLNIRDKAQLHKWWQKVCYLLNYSVVNVSIVLKVCAITFT